MQGGSLKRSERERKSGSRKCLGDRPEKSKRCPALILCQAMDVTGGYMKALRQHMNTTFSGVILNPASCLDKTLDLLFYDPFIFFRPDSIFCA